MTSYSALLTEFSVSPYRRVSPSRNRCFQQPQTKSRANAEVIDTPVLSSVRTQFIKRLVEFSGRHELTIHLIYSPPYHSKYDAVERCWGILEMHWNGALLTDAEAAIEWAKTMTWKGISPVVRVLEGVYHTGVKVAKKVFRAFQKRLRRHNDLGKWDVLIEPNNSPNGVLCGYG